MRRCPYTQQAQDLSLFAEKVKEFGQNCLKDLHLFVLLLNAATLLVLHWCWVQADQQGAQMLSTAVLSMPVSREPGQLSAACFTEVVCTSLNASTQLLRWTAKCQWATASVSDTSWYKPHRTTLQWYCDGSPYRDAVLRCLPNVIKFLMMNLKS